MDVRPSVWGSGAAGDAAHASRTRPPSPGCPARRPPVFGLRMLAAKNPSTAELGVLPGGGHQRRKGGGWGIGAFVTAPPLEPLGPLLGRVHDGQDFDCVRRDPVRHDVGNVGEHPFACPLRRPTRPMAAVRPTTLRRRRSAPTRELPPEDHSWRCPRQPCPTGGRREPSNGFPASCVAFRRHVLGDDAG